MQRNTTAAILATPANQLSVTLRIPEGQEIDVSEAAGTAPAGKKRVYWEKYEHGAIGLYVSDEDLDKHTIPV